MSTIALSLMVDGRTRIEPQGYVPRRDFESYREACREAGARYDPVCKAQVCERGQTQAVLDALRIRELVSYVQPDLRAALEAYAVAQHNRTRTAVRLTHGAEAATAADDGAALYPYQKTGVAWLSGRDRALLADEPGLGKTCQALLAIPKRAPSVVVCPASVKGVWRAEAAKWRPDLKVEVLRGRKSFHWPQPGHAVVLNYDVLPDVVKPGEHRREVLHEKYGPPPDGTILIADECFPSGTLVDTPRGPKAIERVRVGEVVCNAVGAGRVLALSVRRARSMVRLTVGDSTIVVTQNHKFMTGRGWRRALDLVPGQWMMTTHASQALTAMRVLSKAVSGPPVAHQILRNILLGDVENVATRDQSQGLLCEGARQDQRGRPSGQPKGSIAGGALVKADADAQPDVAGRGQATAVGDPSCDGSSAVGARREWRRTDQTGAEALAIPWSDGRVELRDTDWQADGIPVSLQDRRRHPGPAPGDRGRWRITPGPRSPGAGSAQGPRPGFARLDGVEILERRDLEALGYDGGEVVVHNLEVAGHPSYSVNGLLVHNCHLVKNGQSKRTRKFEAVSRAVLDRMGRTWMLSGTPMLNRPSELWYVLHAASLAEEAFGSWPRFLRLFDARKGYFGGYEWGMPAPEVPGLLAKVCLRRRRMDVLPELPPKRYQDILVNGIDKATRTMCDDVLEMLRGCGIELSEAALEVDLRIPEDVMRRISAARTALSAAKIPALLELVESYEEAEEPLIVFSPHRAAIDLVAARPGWLTITGDTPDERRAEVAAAFQSGTHRGLAGTIQAAGTGLTLTKAAHVVFVSLDWTPALNQQAEDRLCRIGQHRGVLVQRLVADHELDRRVHGLLVRKQQLINATMPAAMPDGTTVTG